MKKILVIMIFTVAAVAYAATARAAILVVSTKGEVAFQTGGQWSPVSKGQTLAEGTKISTGLNSGAVLNIDGSLVTVKPLTSIKIYKSSVNPQTRQTSIGLQFGTVQAKINKVDKVKTQFNISTVVATSSVRGTEEIVTYGSSSGMKIEVVEGTIQAHNPGGVSNSVTGRQSFRLADSGAKPGPLNGTTSENASVRDSAKGNGSNDDEHSGVYGNEFFDGIINVSNKTGATADAIVRIHIVPVQ
jgi:hypothetical protein